MNIFRRLERGLFHLLGPAQVDKSGDAVKRADGESRTVVDGGWERRGTPGNYYIVKAERDQEPPA